MKISIIVPVYNAEKYLHNCINSILTQTFTDFELLLINDGSKDKSGEICEEYVAKDSRIRVFHKENGGVSSARNLGLREALGEYVVFIDADDEFLDENSIQILYQPEFDMSICGYINYNVDGIEIFNSGIVKKTVLLNVNETIHLMYSSKYYLFYCYAKMYRTSIIKKYNCFFDESIYYSEDKLFLINYLSLCKKQVYYSSQPIYKYILRSSGAMSSMDAGFNKKVITAYYASLKILSTLRSCFCSPINLMYAKKEVYTSYRRMMARIDYYKVHDENLRLELKTLLLSSIGKWDYVRFSIISAIKRLIYKIIK